MGERRGSGGDILAGRASAAVTLVLGVLLAGMVASGADRRAPPLEAAVRPEPPPPLADAPPPAHAARQAAVILPPPPEAPPSEAPATPEAIPDVIPERPAPDLSASELPAPEAPAPEPPAPESQAAEAPAPESQALGVPVPPDTPAVPDAAPPPAESESMAASVRTPAEPPPATVPPSPRRVVPLRSQPVRIVSDVAPREPVPVRVLQPRPVAPGPGRSDDPEPEPAKVDVGDPGRDSISPLPPASAPPGPEIRVPAAAAVEAGDAVTVAAGRTVLRLLEHGRGPRIEIAWPDADADRARLFDRLRRCFGMEVALMDASGTLYAALGIPGLAWVPNRDRYSGFVRAAEGRLTGAETVLVDEIRRYHGGGLGLGAPVRLFPRAADAALLGGLRQLVGGHYGGAAAIRARYDLTAESVAISEIRVDGRAVPGRIDLSRAARGGCR